MIRYLGIDQGTSGTTVLGFDEAFNCVARAARTVTAIRPEPGIVEQDPWHVLSTIVDAVEDTLQGEDPGNVVAGLAHQGETIIAWNRDTGEPIGNAVVWSDRRSEAVVESMRGSPGATAVSTLTGMHPDPYFCAAKFRFLLDTEPQLSLLSDSLALTTLETWLVYQLGGKEATDLGTASRTQLLELGGNEWNEELLAAFVIDERYLSPIVSSLADRGSLRNSAWGSTALRLMAVAVDQPAALFGNGCFSTGDVKVTYGTGAFLVANAGRDVPTAGNGLIPSVGWSDDKGPVFTLDGGMLSAGSGIGWLRTLGVDVEPAAHERLDPSRPRPMILPALDGLGAPHWEREARGAISMLSASTTGDDLLAGFLDAIAFRVAEIYEAFVDSGYQAPATLRVDGGLTKSRFLMQRQADVLGIPVEVAAEPEATAVGAAMMAAVSSEQTTVEELRPRIAPRELVHPSGDRAARDDYDAWRAFVSAERHRQGHLP